MFRLAVCVVLSLLLARATTLASPPVALIASQLEPTTGKAKPPAITASICARRGERITLHAVLFGKNHGRWLGYDRLEYREALLPQQRSPSLTLNRVSPERG